MYATDENGNPYSPSWWTLNLKSSFDINKAISIDAGIENIMNHRYRPYSSGIVSPGLNLIVAVRANF
jgi:hemoglobin/transferrin/lactoferrin receptor protein